MLLKIYLVLENYFSKKVMVIIIMLHILEYELSKMISVNPRYEQSKRVYKKRLGKAFRFSKGYSKKKSTGGG